MLRFIYILLSLQMAFNAFSNVIEQRNNTYFLPKILSDKDLELYTSVKAYQKKISMGKSKPFTF